ncbi:hypothetical protein ACLOJK_030861 [Asimina triloba]
MTTFCPSIRGKEASSPLQLSLYKTRYSNPRIISLPNRAIGGEEESELPIFAEDFNFLYPRKMKMKRKELEEVYDEFSDFSLASPARKIRRLNADLPPIIEEEETAIPPVFGQPMLDEHLDVNAGQSAAGMEEVVPSLLPNEERALVLYKPVYTPFFQSSDSANVSFAVNTDLVPGLKGHPNIMTEEAYEASMDENVASSNRCLAVVPWVPTNQPPVSLSQQERRDWADGNRLSERMECEEMDVATMEVEEEDPAAYGGGEEQARASAGTGGVEGMTIQQWQQQHCMTLQIPQNNSTPIMWSW